MYQIQTQLGVWEKEFGFYDFCNSRLTKGRLDREGNCLHSRRHFLYVDRDEIPRNRPDRTSGETLPGTRSLQAVAGCGTAQVKIRTLSCL